MFSLSNSFSISCVHSRKQFPLSIFGQREMQNGGWLYLDNHLEKLLEGIFPSKSLFLTMRKDLESLLELLSCQSNFKRHSISITIVRNRDFGRKILSKSFSKWLSKYSHHLFRIYHQPKIDSENGSLKCKQDIERLLKMLLPFVNLLHFHYVHCILSKDGSICPCIFLVRCDCLCETSNSYECFVSLVSKQ